MATIIDGFDASDVEAKWWGWTFTDGSIIGARGNVAPEHRAEFFAAVREAYIASGVATGYGARGIPVDAGLGAWRPALHAYHYVGSTSTGRARYTHHAGFVYDGDDPAMVWRTGPGDACRLNPGTLLLELCPDPVYDRTWQEAAYDGNPYVVTSNFDVMPYEGSRFVAVGSSTGTQGFPNASPWGIDEVIGVVAGTSYDIFVALNKGTAGEEDAAVSWRGAGGGVISTVPLKTSGWAANTWYPISVTATAPVGATHLTIDLSGQLASWNLDRFTVTPTC